MNSKNRQSDLLTGLLTRFQRSRTTLNKVVPTLLMVVFCFACTHQPDVSRDIAVKMSPFIEARNQAIAIATAAKHNLDPANINQVNVKYAALEGEANDYVGFLVESINIGSLDNDKNNKYASDLTKSIKGFDGSVGPLLPGFQQVSADWVASFSKAVGKYLQQNGPVSKLSAQQKTILTEQIKRKAVWPNFEAIAPEPLPITTSH